MAATFWSNVQVAVQSALATAVDIDDIAKQAAAQTPRQVQHSGSDPSDGDYVVMQDILGMWQVNQRVFRVDNQVAGSFDMEGVNTTDYDTYNTTTKGSFAVITFGTTITTLTDINASGGEPEFADITTIHDNIRRQAPTVTSPSTFSFESLWDPSDAGLIALKAASDAIAERAFKFTFSNGKIVVFNGYISAPGAPTGTAQDTVKTSVVITTAGSVTSYAS